MSAAAVAVPNSGGGGSGGGGGGGGARPPRSNLRDANIVKIAVQMPTEADKLPQLLEFNQRQPLASIVHELCQLWGLSDPDHYALQFSDANNKNYVTEKNRNEIKNGSVLTLEQAPSKTAEEILSQMTSTSVDQRTDALRRLCSLSPDNTFAQEFISKKGHTQLIASIETGKFEGQALAFALSSFVELMDQGVMSWDILENQFINKIASYINNHSPTQDSSVVKSCLSILENIVLNGTGKNVQVEKEITIPNLIMHLHPPSDNQVIQQNTLALINALFLKADISKRKAMCATLSSKQVRNVICCRVIQTQAEVGTEMAHQLYVMQTLCLSLLEQRMVKIDPQDQDALEKVKELRRIAFENDGIGMNVDITTRRQLGYAKDYKKLGFKNDINPLSDLAEEQCPGVLALDCMIYFARNNNEAYTKVVLENSCRVDEHECPFGRTSIELVKLMCEILRIKEPPSEQGQTYHPMIFTHDHPFEEFFCICIVLLNKTWKEMRATAEDFVKVFSVVKEQILRALLSSPMGFDKFRQKIQQLTYLEIRQIWQQERTTREEWESHARPIVELKEQITPEIMDLIKQQRLGLLVNGTRLSKYSRGQRIKDKFWFVRLSPNHKVLHYGDCDEKSNPSVEELSGKLVITDIKGLIVGKECPHVKDKKGGKIPHHLAFSLTLDSVDMTSLDFVAPDEQVFDYWTDGINALLSNKMVSKMCENDLETLLSMDIKLRLLDAEGIDIPQDPPPIPPEPDNYDFYYDLK
ncbi:engulfment and cell motility Ced-12 [Arctopsyche grandis]|uniref:engulfment and cell motility Ced-12 n=1 Tax=Arctopsyche grandis TaxID=121162 RepID=UPI00406D8AA9